MKSPREPEPLTIMVTDLIDHGPISVPATAFGTHSGKRIEARLTSDGTFVHRGNTYSSPSVAAGRAITAEVDTLSIGRGYLSINGWKFWQVVCPDGKIRTLSEIRDQLLFLLTREFFTAAWSTRNRRGVGFPPASNTISACLVCP
jgi:RAMA domain-containing protein